ncbi:ATP-binding cassette sub-family A member 1-like protein [Dinothrombium tinctorium]|uniref:ATP-binding cassette sub-family A member 1-like protein n=1 Tax=Dinothrombium tinctorium TaxID=1965070 RepID=A0A3S3QLI1_9ACAR|nr:ATP-binding cassette sub-family A member 1-like protein [Dinothrombium tinctorium]RWS14067.1 ATP-binding cassette sub-family A member 1-like protein [Dinothrombium tinctorium]
MYLLIQQFLILLWKCFTLRKRHFITTAFETILPLLTSATIALLYANLTREAPSNSTVRPQQEYAPPEKFLHPDFNLRTSFTFDLGKSDQYVLFAPNNNFTRKFADEMRNVLTEASGEEAKTNFLFFDNEDKLIAYYVNITDQISSYRFSAVIFEEKVSLRNFAYKIRVDQSNIEDASQMFPLKFSPSPRIYCKYSSSFAPLQAWINEAYLNLVHQSDQTLNRPKTKNVFAYKMPYPKYMLQPPGSLIDMIPFLVVFGFIVTAPIIVKRLADEKVSRCREMYRLMGLSDWVFWGSTLVNYFIIYALQAAILTFLFTAKLNGVNAVINYGNPIIIYLAFLIYGISFIMQSMLISVPFNRPVFGVIVTILIWVISYLLPAFLFDPNLASNIDVKSTESKRIFFCLIPNVALHFFFRFVGQRNLYGNGSTFANLFEQIPAFGSLSEGLILLLMLASAVLSGILIWYLEAVWPWQFGVPKPFYFPCLPSYWCQMQPKYIVDEEDSKRNEKFFERRMSASEVAISIQNLRKEFGIGFMKKVAVNNASLEINREQITVLLGHNGAGKTTMMNIITGIYPPTSGEVFIEGYNVITDTKEARKSMSLCPQHNVIYDELTVEEHLKLFAAIKGTPWSLLKDEVSKTMNQLNISQKSHFSASSLSGGMKRKLCLGIALIGDTKIVILDEPTSGMDPDARRTVWDLLQSVRKERTILITTHFMEEADALADRIAIMAQGEVKCCGTPMFLKRIFGSGYQLRIAKEADFNQEQVTALVHRYFPNACIANDRETEIVYRLENNENSSESTKALSSFFEAFEAKKSELYVSSCGLSVTTIEDVFLGVNSIDNDNEETDLNKVEANTELCVSELGGDSIIGLSDNSMQKLSGFMLIIQQLKGLLLKRFNFTKRYLPMFIFQLIIPTAIFYLVLYADNRSRETSKESSKQINFNLKTLYGLTTVIYQSEKSEPNFADLAEYYSRVAKNEGATVLQIPPSTDLRDFLLNKSDDMTLNEYIKSFIVGASVEPDSSSSSFVYNVFFNNEALHSFPISLNIIYNAIVNSIALNASTYSIDVSAEALPSKEDFSESIIRNYIILPLMWMLLVPIALPFLAASYVLFPIHERASKAKLLQLMSGLHPFLFWLANFIFDLTTHILCSYLIIIIFALMDKHEIFLSHFESASALFLLLIFFGIACIPLAYVWSFIFAKSSTGFAVLVIVFLLLGIVLSPVDVVLKMIPDYESTYDTFQWIVRISPLMALTKGIIKLYDIGSKGSICDAFNKEILELKCTTLRPGDLLSGCCFEKCQANNNCYKWTNPYKWGKQGILEELVMLTADFILFTFILVLCELNVSKLYFWIMKKMKKSSTSLDIHMNSVEDSDVSEERHRVEELLLTDSLIVSKLSKRFGNFQAVKNLSFAVHKEECFGLLGVNGAGKTTTFRMLVGDLFPTSGNAYCCGYNLKSSLREFQKNIGYCPQFDALLSKLTGREMLCLFGRLRGIREKDLSSAVKELIILCDLTKHADKRTETYSGGTCRKLSLAIALIGSPKLLFLDEPSSGVDPGARRKLWKTLSYIRQYYGCSIVLTSHSMDECEALCGRISIMVNGEFKCLGSFQHLRNKFGKGYTMKIKVKKEKLKPEFIDSLKKHISQLIPSSVLKNVSETIFEYHVTDVTLSWSAIFRALESVKSTFDLEDYILSDTSLEQIFISFARSQV